MRPLVYSVNDVLELVGISRAKLYQVINAGDIKVRKVGKRSLILATDLDAWLESLPTIDRSKKDK